MGFRIRKGNSYLKGTINEGQTIKTIWKGRKGMNGRKGRKGTCIN